LRVVCRGHQGYAWYLSTKARSDALSWSREGFTGPVDAMRDADQHVSRVAPRMFERLTPGEARELYRKLARAYDCGDGQRDQTLGEVRGELFRHLQILATDPSYSGPEPHKFIAAVKDASYGAALQAMAASPNRAAWIAATSRHQRGERPAAAARRTASAAGPASRARSGSRR
jgi:hypothetical protein